MGLHWVWQIAKEGKLVGTQRSSTWCFGLFLFCQIPFSGALHWCECPAG